MYQINRKGIYYATNGAGTTNYFGGGSYIFTIIFMPKQTKYIDRLNIKP